MGVVVGKLNWEGHNEMIEELEKLRRKHRLDLTDIHNLYKRRYGVEISGPSLAWTSERYARCYINTFLKEAQEMFRQRDIKCETEVEFLPP